MPADPEFYTVHAVMPGSGDFEIVGIFSKKDEAEALADKYRASSEHFNAGGIDGPMSMQTVLDMLCKQRLGAVGAALEKLGFDLSAAGRAPAAAA